MQLTSLQTLTLRNNKLETFPLEMLRVIPLVDLEGNPAYLEMFLNCELEDEEEEANKRSARRQALHRCTVLGVCVCVCVCAPGCVSRPDHCPSRVHWWFAADLEIASGPQGLGVLSVPVLRNMLITAIVWSRVCAHLRCVRL